MLSVRMFLLYSMFDVAVVATWRKNMFAKQTTNKKLCLVGVAKYVKQNYRKLLLNIFLLLNLFVM